MARSIQRSAFLSGSTRLVQGEAEQLLRTTTRQLQGKGLADEFERELLEARLEELESVRFSASWLLVYGPSAVGLVTAVALFLLRDQSTGPFGAYAIIALVTGVVLTGAMWGWTRARNAAYQAEVGNIRRKLAVRAVSVGDVTATSSSDSVQAVQGGGTPYFANLVKINVDNLSDYYAQVRVHTNNSFLCAVAAGLMGFILVALGIGWGFVHSDETAIALAATASGVLTEFIASVFFILYNRTVRQLKEYHDSLLDVQNILLAFQIVTQADAERSGELFSKILDFLLQHRSDASASDVLLPQHNE